MTNKITSKLQAIIKVLSVRGAGHTYTMLNGVKNNKKAFCLVHDYNFGKQLGLDDNQIITIDNIDIKLIGQKTPIAIDNCVLENLLRESLRYINQLEAEKEK